jgi:NADPH-dependent curcumin reductase CurA
VTDRSRTHRCWRLVARPVGRDFAPAFRLEATPVPTPGPGEVLIRNEFISLDAGTRMWLTARTDGYQPPLPLGTPMVGLVVGRVVESHAPGFPVGALVRAFGTWAEYSCVAPATSGLTVLDESAGDPRHHLGVYGMNAWTAYVGIVETGRTRPGETVLVSAAAGATGQLAVQIARNMGCRVYGFAGGPAKCAYLKDSLGLDGAIDYKSAGVEAALDAIDGGVDVYFDNVGGPLLDLVLPRMAHYGRVAVCGLLAGYGDQPAPGPARFDQVLMRRLTIQGFFSPDFAARGPEINRILRRWVEAGRLTLPFDETVGLENLLDAYGKLFSGANLGKVVVRL